MGVVPNISDLAPRRMRCALIGVLAALLVAVTPVGAQSAAAPSYSQDELDVVALQLNTRPRKTLGFMTPAAKLAESVALTA